jgi:hypothetical protein
MNRTGRVIVLQGALGLGDDLFCLTTNRLGFGFCGDDFFVFKQRGNQIAAQCFSVAGVTAKSFATYTMAHDETSFLGYSPRLYSASSGSKSFS